MPRTVTIRLELDKDGCPTVTVVRTHAYRETGQPDSIVEKRTNSNTWTMSAIPDACSELAAEWIADVALDQCPTPLEEASNA